MESSSVPSASSSSNDDSNAQDPLALPNANDSFGMYAADVNRGGDRSNKTSVLNTMKDSSGLNDNQQHAHHNPSNIKHEEHHSLSEARLQFDSNHHMTTSNYAQAKMNHMSIHHHQQQQQQQQLNLHEPHKTFSHSIENLSKTTEKCPPNDMKM